MVVSTDGFIFGQLLVENLFIPIVGQVVYSKYVGIQGETKLAHQHRMGQFQFLIYEDSTSGNIASSTIRRYRTYQNKKIMREGNFKITATRIPECPDQHVLGKIIGYLHRLQIHINTPSYHNNNNEFVNRFYCRILIKSKDIDRFPKFLKRYKSDKPILIFKYHTQLDTPSFNGTILIKPSAKCSLFCLFCISAINRIQFLSHVGSKL